MSTVTISLKGVSEVEEHMLTTVDNPYNPFTHFDEWNAYDTGAGYHTLSFLARVTVTSLELSEADQAVALETAMDEIIFENVSGVHRKVAAPSPVLAKIPAAEKF